MYAHRNIVGRYRDANVVHGRGQRPSTGRPPTSIGSARPGRGARRRRQDGARRARSTIGELTAFVLYLTAFFAPIQQLVQLYTTYQSGPGGGGQAARPAGHPAHRRRSSPTPTPLPADRRRTSCSTRRHVRLRPGHAGAPRRVDLRIAPGETFALVGRDRRGQVHDRQAREPLLRPDRRPDPARRPRPARRHAGVAAPPARRRAAGAVPVRRHPARQRRLRPARRHRRRGARRACRAVGLDDLLDRLPDGIDTLVHERGTSLSSGERQLLALARAFLARPRVLVLDEATSNLDLKSESQIERALDVVLDGRTAILIAHRLATAMRADRIAVVARRAHRRARHPRRARPPGRAVRGDVRHVVAAFGVFVGFASYSLTLDWCSLGPAPHCGATDPAPTDRLARAIVYGAGHASHRTRRPARRAAHRRGPPPLRQPRLHRAAAHGRAGRRRRPPLRAVPPGGDGRRAWPTATRRRPAGRRS